jgi:hypothetical protein
MHICYPCRRALLHPPKILYFHERIYDQDLTFLALVEGLMVMAITYILGYIVSHVIFLNPCGIVLG